MGLEHDSNKDALGRTAHSVTVYLPDRTDTFNAPVHWSFANEVLYVEKDNKGHYYHNMPFYVLHQD